MTDATNSTVQALLNRARGPLGPRVQVDFGIPQGPLAELAHLLNQLNGFFAYNAGVIVFRVGEEGLGPELLHWNESDTWKYSYDGLADDLFCFGQDVLGTQFALDQAQRVVTFDPETAQREIIGSTLEEWASWLADEPNVNATESLAYAWQQENGPLEPHQRLIPRQFFIAGGEYSLPNLLARDAIETMRIRGPIAQQVYGLPPGAQVTMKISD